MAQKQPGSARELIDLWPTHRLLAEDVGVSQWRVAKWHQRSSIPPEHWAPVIRAAAQRGYGDFSLELFLEFLSAA